MNLEPVSTFLWRSWSRLLLIIFLPLTFFGPIECSEPKFPDRQQLCKALCGDFALMLSLMEQWQTELADFDFERVQLLYSRFERQPTASFRHQKILPQTFSAAAILLALAYPEQIIALPAGLRQIPDLSSPKHLAEIFLDVEQLTPESIFIYKPDLAFVAPYTDPRYLRMLERQNIPLCMLSNVYDLESLKNVLIVVGEQIGRLIEAELLLSFIEAGFKFIDNRLKIHLQQKKSSFPIHLICMEYYGHLAPLQPKSTTDFLLSRLTEKGICQLIPLCQQMKSLPGKRPDGVIIATSFTPFNLQRAEKKLRNSPFADFKCHYIDIAIQHSPSQHLLLAYYDLADAIMCVANE